MGLIKSPSVISLISWYTQSTCQGLLILTSATTSHVTCDANCRNGSNQRYTHQWRSHNRSIVGASALFYFGYCHQPPVSICRFVFEHWQIKHTIFLYIQNFPWALLAGLEPARGDPNGFLVHRLNHSATTTYCKLQSQCWKRCEFKMYSPRLRQRDGAISWPDAQTIRKPLLANTCLSLATFLWPLRGKNALAGFNKSPSDSKRQILHRFNFI